MKNTYKKSDNELAIGSYVVFESVRGGFEGQALGKVISIHKVIRSVPDSKTGNFIDIDVLDLKIKRIDNKDDVLLYHRYAYEVTVLSSNEFLARLMF